MRIARHVALSFAIIALSSPILLAGGFENSGLGTAARGMGGAFRAVADDWSAAYYNPAGYAFIVDNQYGGAVGLVHLRNEITPNYVDNDDFGNGYGWGIANGHTVYNFHRIHNNPSAGVVARLPIWGETVFGLSVYQPFDNNIRWRLYAPDALGVVGTAYNPEVIGSGEIPGHDYLNDLDVVAFQLTAGRTFMDEKLALGVGLQLLRADLWFSDLTFRTNPRGDLNPLVDDRPWDRIPEFSDNAGYGWGFGFKVGALYKVNEKLNLALTGHLPFDIKVTGTSSLTFIMPLRGYGVAVDPAGPDYDFVRGKTMIMGADFETDVKLPASLGFGIAYQPMEKLTVTFDAEYTIWSNYDGFQFDYSNVTGLPKFVARDLEDAAAVAEAETWTNEAADFYGQDLANPVTWENSGKVAFGVRWLTSESLTLLAGGSADQSPARASVDFMPHFTDLGTKYGYNGGGILHIDRWDLGVVTSYFSYPDRIVGELTDADGDDMFDSFPGEYKAATYETVVSVSYRF